MKKRQFLAALLALTCAASMAVPAFAAGPTVDTAVTTEDLDFDAMQSYQLSVSTDIQQPTLKVTLPASTSVLINPYRIEVAIPGGGTSFDTVLSPEMDIINNSGCAVKVGVKGLLQTYTILDATDVKSSAIDTSDCDITNETGIDLTKVYESASKAKVYVEVDNGVAKQVTLTYTAPTYNTPGDSTSGVKKNGSVKVTGYTASKDIKVATAAMKDPDTEKSNSLFVYVEGKQDGGEWATAFDAKAIAGVKDTKTGVMSTTGMMALSAKDTTANILYLAGGATGHTRVTGQAATAPTKAWMSITDTFDANFTFVIDAVANAAPTAPVLQTIKFANIAPASGAAGDSIAVTGNAVTGLTWDVGATSNNSGNITPTCDKTATLAFVSSTDTSIISWDTANNRLKANADGKATVTLSFTSQGVTSTYTFEITVSNS